MKRILLVGCACLSLSACASQPSSIPASYVSTVQYKSYDCDQIAAEMEAVTRRVTELHGGLKKKADNDAVQMGVGLVLLWPVLFALEGGDGADAAEYGRLKGEMQALEKAAIQKKCDIEVREVPVDKPAPKKSGKSK